MNLALVTDALVVDRTIFAHEESIGFAPTPDAVEEPNMTITGVPLIGGDPIGGLF